ATSTGSPPWLIAFSLRPTSRVAKGTAAVILVSMETGATAVNVMLVLGESGSQCVDLDALPQLVGEAVDQADHAVLGGVVVRLAHVAGDARDRGHAAAPAIVVVPNVFEELTVDPL